jgi:hypothetical protein
MPSNSRLFADVIQNKRSEVLDAYVQRTGERKSRRGTDSYQAATSTLSVIETIERGRYDETTKVSKVCDPWQHPYCSHCLCNSSSFTRRTRSDLPRASWQSRSGAHDYRWCQRRRCTSEKPRGRPSGPLWRIAASIVIFTVGRTEEESTY